MQQFIAFIDANIFDLSSSPKDDSPVFLTSQNLILSDIVFLKNGVTHQVPSQSLLRVPPHISVLNDLAEMLPDQVSLLTWKEYGEEQIIMPSENYKNTFYLRLLNDFCYPLPYYL